MKKLIRIFGIALVLVLVASLSFGSVALADEGPTEGVVSITMEGSDFDFEVWTLTANVQDVFRGEAIGSMEMAQSVRFQSSGQWTSDAPDIDRYGEFTGDGSFETGSWYDSTKAWWDGASYTKYYVESDTYGFLGQNMHFDGNWGGVKNVDQWKKQRDAQLYAEGNYFMSLSSVDQRGLEADYGFNFVATDSGSWGNLYVGTLATIAGHNAPDKLIADFIYTYDGSPGVAVAWLAETGGDIDVIIDLIGEFVSGTGTIW